MELGALVCTPREPQCQVCPVANVCVARKKGLVSVLPMITPRPAATKRRFIAFVVHHKGKILVRRRPARVVNAHLWEFPNTEILPGDGDLQKAAKLALGLKPAVIGPICQIRHSITRYAISLDVYEVTLNGQNLKADGKWVKRNKLGVLPFCSAHKKILARLNDLK